MKTWSESFAYVGWIQFVFLQPAFSAEFVSLSEIESLMVNISPARAIGGFIGGLFITRVLFRLFHWLQLKFTGNLKLARINSWSLVFVSVIGVGAFTSGMLTHAIIYTPCIATWVIYDLYRGRKEPLSRRAEEVDSVVIGREEKSESMITRRKKTGYTIGEIGMIPKTSLAPDERVMAAIRSPLAKVIGGLALMGSGGGLLVTKIADLFPSWGRSSCWSEADFAVFVLGTIMVGVGLLLSIKAGHEYLYEEKRNAE